MTSTKYIKAINTIKKEGERSYNGNYYIFSYGISVYIGNAFRYIMIDCVEYCAKLDNTKGLPRYYELAQLEKDSKGYTYNNGKQDIMNVTTLAPRLKKMFDNCYNPAFDSCIESRKPHSIPERYITNGNIIAAVDADIWEIVVQATGENLVIYMSDNNTSPIKLMTPGLIFVTLPIRIKEEDSIPNFIRSEYSSYKRGIA